MFSRQSQNSGLIFGKNKTEPTPPQDQLVSLPGAVDTSGYLLKALQLGWVHPGANINKRVFDYSPFKRLSQWLLCKALLTNLQRR